MANTIPFLSQEWFAKACSLVQDVSVSHGGSCRLQFQAGETRWFMTLADGQIRGWDLGSVDEPDVELRWRADDAWLVMARELRGDAALDATTVVAAVPDGTYIGPPAPLNLGSRVELASLPAVPGATFGVQYRYRNGPFGDVNHVLRFEDGRLAQERLGTLDGADVVVGATYRAMAQVRAGERTILEALEEGSVTGELGPLAALAGILESPEFHAAERATGRHAFALAALGELDADPVFAAAMERLMSMSERP
jgi:hypothetical protein